MVSQLTWSHREAFQALKTANASLWSRAGAKVGQLSRHTLRAVGNAIKAAGRAAGVAGAVLAISEASDASQEIANAMTDYARHEASGDIALMDLDALEAAIGIQTITGNYFITMEVVGILLP